VDVDLTISLLLGHWIVNPASAWPRGCAHEDAMRLALASGVRLAMSRAERGDAASSLALRDVTQRQDPTRLRQLLTDALEQLRMVSASPSTIAVMHLRLASVALLQGDRSQAEACFLAASGLEVGDGIAERGLKHIRGG
jgi:hypothetical protein